MRYLPDVISSILEVVPEEMEDLKSSLQAVHTSTMYAAPEIMGDYWRGVAGILAEYMGTKKQEEGWQREVQQIWTGEPE